MKERRKIFGNIVHNSDNTFYFPILKYKCILMYLYIIFTEISICVRLVCICMSSDFHLPKCKKPLHCLVVSSICIILVGPALPSMFNSEAFLCLSSWKAPTVFAVFRMSAFLTSSPTKWWSMKLQGTGVSHRFWCWGTSPTSCLPVRVKAAGSAVISKML